MEQENKDSIQTMSFINLILGAWLIVSPWILGYVSGSKWNQLGLGISIAALSLIRLAAPRQSWISAINGLAGIWLIIAPFILSYTKSAAYWNEIIVGIVVAFVAFTNSSITTGHRAHHGTA